MVESPSRSSPVSVVDAIDSPPARVRESEAVFDPLRAALSRGDLAGFKLHDITLGEVEFLAVETQERFKFVVRAADIQFAETDYIIS